MGRLDVRIVEARNLPDTQWISKPDPYVRVKLENHQHKTRVLENNLNPKWDEVFKFIVSDENSSQLKIELWNSNVVSDEFLGQYTLSLNGLTRGLVRDEWFLLQQCKSNAEVRVRILAVDFGKDPTPDQQKTIAGQGVVTSPMPGAPGGYPPQQQQPGAYPPHPQGAYPPQPQGYPQQPVAYPPQGGYPPQQPGYPPQQPGYPPQQPGYGGYPPQQPGYPPQQPGYPPQQPGYPPQQPGYPPQQPGYGGYPPQQPGYPPQPQYAQGYPPQQPGYGY